MERSVPLPVSQFIIRDRSGSFVCRADFAYPDRRLLIELDGRAFHEGEDSFQSDRDKQNITQGLGWTTLRFTWYDITRRPDYTIELIGRTLRVLA
jgi:very-short-patch-repair endonuclease